MSEDEKNKDSEFNPGMTMGPFPKFNGSAESS